MKDIKQKVIPLLKKGYCTPQIARLAQKLKEPATTIQYNIKKMEQDGWVTRYKAVFDYGKIGQGFCAFLLLNLSADEYGDPEQVGRELARHAEIESVDVCTGDCELILKVRAKDQDTFYQFLRTVISRRGVVRTKPMVSLKQVKTEFGER
jgi:DNA-binding Lrp family transcriptional regulator